MKKFKNSLLLAAIATVSISLTLLPSQFTNEKSIENTIMLEQLINDLSDEQQAAPDQGYTTSVTEYFTPEFQEIYVEGNPASIEKSENVTENNIKIDLAHFHYKSASVLPFFTSRREKYVILSREAYGRPKIGKKWTYDDFGGTRDAEDNGPLVTASREFFEEAILNKSLHLTLDETCNYVNSNTHFVIANTTKQHAKHVTYIVDFKKYKNKFIRNFYTARANAKTYETKEKDRIAIVKWSDIKKAFMEQENDSDAVYVHAKIIDPQTGRGLRQDVKLRTYFVIKLKNFFLDQPCRKGTNKKIHFYS